MRLARRNTFDDLGYVNESDDMDGKLAKDGTDNVRIEDIRLGSFFGEAFDRLVSCISIEAVRRIRQGAYLCS